MIVVSYRGYKIIAQGIIPGILSVDQINCSQYGSEVVKPSESLKAYSWWPETSREDIWE